MEKVLKPTVFNVYDLAPVPNVCEQVLREVIKLPLISMAHVTMEKGNVSLLHKHEKMREFYFILEGEGVLYHGDRALDVSKSAFLIIPAGVLHKLKNIGNGTLEHLVFVSPPFNATDVSLVEDDKKEPSTKTKYTLNKAYFNARDGAVVYELDSHEERIQNGVAFAYGTLSPKRKALKHFHRISDEIYYIISGKGNIKLGDSIYSVKKGSVVYVPVNILHGLENVAEEELEVLCLSIPPYQDNDFILA